MSTTISRSPNPAIREVARGLAAARDAQIMQVLAMVDAMPNRGAADQLIAPLRTRLARLRPPRPLRFARLLFLPLDPLIVPAARWRAEQPTIPRTVIPLLATTIEAVLGAAGEAIVALIAGRTTQDHPVVREAGGKLWPLAAEALLEAEAPAGWDGTGLGAHLYKPLARRIGALLYQAERLDQMTADAAQGLVPPEPNAVRALLTEAMRHDAHAQPMAIALLLARIPEAAPLLMQVATTLGQREGLLLRHAGEQAADILLDQLETPGGAEGQLGGVDLAEAGATVRRLTSLLSALDGESLSGDRRERLNGLRQRIRTGCESLFTERLTTDLLEPLHASGTETGASGRLELETAARGLRALETEARRAGDTKTYDALLEQAAETVREMTERGEIDRVDGLRLVEIVAGPDAALALLGEEMEV